jgi:hypothetical protein
MRDPSSRVRCRISKSVEQKGSARATNQCSRAIDEYIIVAGTGTSIRYLPTLNNQFKFRYTRPVPAGGSCER